PTRPRPWRPRHGSRPAATRRQTRLSSDWLPPVPKRLVADDVWSMPSYLLEARQQLRRPIAEPQQRERSEDPRQAQKIVVVRREPDPRPRTERRHTEDLVPGDRQSIEVEHHAERPLEAVAKCSFTVKSREGLLVQERRTGIERAPLREREQPLDVIVHRLVLL